ncbi:MAG: hypothetical protein AB7H88_18305 [Vicinamibacterales bacterium]
MNIVFPLPRFLRPLVAVALAVAAVQPAAAQRAVTFAVPGASATQPITVNNRGVTAGAYFSDTGWGAFIREATGEIATIQLPDAQTWTSYMSLNVRGTLVGTYVTSGSLVRGFIRTADGEVAPFDVPGAGATLLTAINDQGTMVGAYLDSTMVDGAGFVVTRDGDIVEITGDPGDIYAPVAINNAGTVVGVVQRGNGVYAGLFVRDARGAITRFGIPAEPSRPGVTRVDVPAMLPVGINAAGVVAGYYQFEEWAGDTSVAAGVRGFVRHPDGTVEVFSAPGSTIDYPWGASTLTVAQGISNAGTIVGYQQTTPLGYKAGFLRNRAGDFTVVDVEGALQTHVTGMSPSGLIVGTYLPADSQSGVTLGFIVR